MVQKRKRLDFTIGRRISLMRRLKAVWRMILKWLKSLSNRAWGMAGKRRSIISQRTFTVCWLSASSSGLIAYALLFARWFIHPTDQWGRITVFILGLSYWAILTFIINKAVETYGLWKAASMVQSKGSRMPKRDRLLEGAG